MQRTRTMSVALLLVVGVVGAFIAVYQLTGARPIPAKTAKAAVTVPIITDPGSGNLTSGPIAGPATRNHTLEGSRVRMSELGIDLPIVEGDGQNVPLFKAAHYPGMMWPGQGGRSLLYAHARPGMFGPLFGARVGQKVEVQTVEGRVLRYVIRQYYPHWPDNDLSILQPVDHEQLVLLTCTSWTASDPKIIAIAEPVG